MQCPVFRDLICFSRGILLTFVGRRIGEAEEISDEARKNTERCCVSLTWKTKRKRESAGGIEGCCTSHSVSSSFSRRHGVASASCTAHENIMKSTNISLRNVFVSSFGLLSLLPVCLPFLCLLFFHLPLTPGFHVHPLARFVLARSQPHGRCSPRRRYVATHKLDFDLPSPLDSDRHFRASLLPISCDDARCSPRPNHCHLRDREAS